MFHCRGSCCGSNHIIAAEKAWDLSVSGFEVDLTGPWPNSNLIIVLEACFSLFFILVYLTCPVRQKTFHRPERFAP
jgi:hypothetical protein